LNSPLPSPAPPRPLTVLREQLRTVSGMLRVPAIAAGGVLTLIVMDALRETFQSGARFGFRPELSMLPPMAGLLLPIAVWKGEDRFGPGFFWSLPVDRRVHALLRVCAGWVWLMAAVAVFVLGQLLLTLLSGGNVLGEETLQLLPTPVFAERGSVSAEALRAVAWTPRPLLWLAPFTGATTLYVIGSAVALGLRHPLRWIIGFGLGCLMFAFTSRAADARWLGDMAERLVQTLFVGPFGLDAVMTARTETLSTVATLPNGETVGVWRGLPDLGQWAIATLLWFTGGAVALWAAASRHRERRPA
jgi:hypothetical protein